MKDTQDIYNCQESLVVKWTHHLQGSYLPRDTSRENSNGTLVTTNNLKIREMVEYCWKKLDNMDQLHEIPDTFYQQVTLTTKARTDGKISPKNLFCL